MFLEEGMRHYVCDGVCLLMLDIFLLQGAATQWLDTPGTMYICVTELCSVV